MGDLLKTTSLLIFLNEAVCPTLWGKPLTAKVLSLRGLYPV